MNARQIVFVLATALVVPPAWAQGGFTDIFRSISGALRGKDAPPPAQEQNNYTATIGVRGMDEADAKTGAAAGEDYTLMEGWAATKPEAESAAQAKGLVARTVNLAPAGNKPAPAQ